MSHAEKADKLLIKPAAGARPAPPRTRRQFIPKARTRRPVTRRVTRGTATTRLATAPDRPPGESYRHPTGMSRTMDGWWWVVVAAGAAALIADGGVAN
jgi:hypothetical protein